MGVHYQDDVVIVMIVPVIGTRESNAWCSSTPVD